MGGNEIAGLYFELGDPDAFFNLNNVFAEEFDSRGLWNNYSYQFGWNPLTGTDEIPDLDPIRNQVSVVDFPIHYGRSTTNNTLALTSGNTPVSTAVSNGVSRRIKILVKGGNLFRTYYLSTVGGYNSYTSASGVLDQPMSFNPAAPNDIIDPVTGNIICRVTFIDGPGYLLNDYFIINYHSKRDPGNGLAVINSSMDVNLYQNSVGNAYLDQSYPKTYSRCAIVNGSLADTWRPILPNSSPNFRDRPIEAGAVLEFQITEAVYYQDWLNNPGGASVTDPFAQYVQPETPNEVMTFVSSRRYKNIEEWFYEDKIYQKWDGHPNKFNSTPQKGASCRVLFTRGDWRTTASPSGSADTDFQYNLQNNEGWSNQMFQQRNFVSIAPLGYSDWPTYIASELPVRMVIVSSYNADFQQEATVRKSSDQLCNIAVKFTINQASRGRPVFETKSTSEDIDIFYETKTFDIDRVNNTHQGNVQNQGVVAGGQPAVVSLNTTTLTGVPTKTNEENSEFNAFTFGNGVEAMTIRADWNGTKLKYSPRVSTPIDNYGQERLQASLTYSGVFRENTTVNNLNEFNLSLANFKDLQIEYGPVRKIHARDTDVVVFQEDKVSKVLYGKNLLSDSAGGGNVASIPEVLGTQITYAGEYGISENPESFAYWGNDMYFADAKRGAVCRLGLNGIFEISQQGMSDYFKDLFRDNFRTQKLGAIDPFKEQYVIADTDTPAPPCNFEFFVDIPATDGGVTNQAGDYTIQVVSTQSWTLTLEDAGFGIGWASLNGNNPSLSGFGNETVTLTLQANAGASDRVINIGGTSCAGAITPIPVTQSKGLLVVRDVVGAGLNADGVNDLEADFEYESLSTGLVAFNNTKITPDSKTAFAFDAVRAIETKNGIPETGANLTMRATQTGAIGRKSFEPSLGTKMYYCLTNTKYEPTQIDEIIADPGTVTLAPTLAGGVYSDTFIFNNAANNEYF